MSHGRHWAKQWAKGVFINLVKAVLESDEVNNASTIVDLSSLP